MELPRRARGDELLKPGELTRLRERLRIRAREHDLATVIACAFDHRTRMLPFIFADTRMIPAGVRADRVGDGRRRLREDPDRPAAVEPQFPAVADAPGRPHPRPVHGFEHEPALRAVHGADPRRPPDRPYASTADHRRRPARRLRALGRLQRGSRQSGKRRCRRHRRGIRPAEPPRGRAVRARSRRVDASGRSFARATAGSLDAIPGLVYSRGDSERRCRRS